MSAKRIFFPHLLASVAILLACTPGFAQVRRPAVRGVGVNLSGMWSAMYHEDELERTDPGPPPGDYLGFPINEAARYRADAWDGDLVSVPEHQCIPHAAPYAMRGPSNLKISTVDDPTTHQITAFIIDGTYDGPRTIWMDGRPHPGLFASHTWSGFSTGTWEGDTLRIDTSHIKAGYLRRNGIQFSDEVKLTEFIDLHDKYLTLTSVVEDPVYLTEPFVRSESWVWNPYQVFAPVADFGACLPAPEIPRPYGWVPHHLPGDNPMLSEFSLQYGIPYEATRGGAGTMYPEYKKLLRKMTIPRPKVFDTQFAREHSAEKAQ